MWQPFWTVTEPPPGLLVPRSGILASRRGKSERTEKNEQKWARYGLTKRVRVADLFVMDRYRNKIKGLNWYRSVRDKLDDPRYAGWFVKFRNYTGRASNTSYAVPACDVSPPLLSDRAVLR